MSQDKPRLGKLPPMYNFILNPHAETRLSRCPGCEERMRQRKLPLFIHVDPVRTVVINYTCRYCPDCDLLIAHQDEIEHLLAGLFAEHDPDIVGNDYLVMGTVERAAWRESMRRPMSIPEILEHMHDFKEVLKLEYQPAGWYRDEDVPDKPAPRKRRRKRRKRR